MTNGMLWTTQKVKSVEYVHSESALQVHCLGYEPFLNVEGGIDRACRGADPFDDWPSSLAIF